MASLNADKPESSAIPPLNAPYLLVINVPLYVDSKGRFYAEELWYKDLTAHLNYIFDFSIACPVVRQEFQKNFIPLASDARYSNVKIVELPSPTGSLSALLQLPRTIWKLWGAIRNCRIVHSGVAGWPYPLGWVAIPLARLLRKRSLIIVESAPWRIPPGARSTFKSAFRSGLYERIARWCLRRTDLAIFTQEEYRQSLLLERYQSGHVIHASWIDDNVILSVQQATDGWKEKTDNLDSSNLQLLFAGRLEPEKGVLVLLEAISQLAKTATPLQLTILGSGSLAQECHALSRTLVGVTRVNMLGTVAYGPPLFALIRQQHVVVVPSISDEQPRIIYDSYSQAVPILASKTPGLVDCVSQGKTGWLVDPNDSAALAALLARAVKDRKALQQMGIQALDAARAMTHQKMHSDRQKLLLHLQ